MPQTAKNFFTAEQQEDILQAIRDAELNTSGEIRLHIETKCKGEVLDCAAYVFKKLGMHKTQQRNGVLIYLSIENRTFAVIGDVGINSVVPENFWESTKQLMINHFRESRFTEGLIEGIAQAGLQLKKHFPYQTNDVNELPDELSFGNN
jgi:uncharacterized membrane protein